MPAKNLTSVKLSFLCWYTLCLSLQSCLHAQNAEKVSYNSDVKPLLSDACYQCHGPDVEHREGGFRLDLAESALGEAYSGLHPIVPGNPDASEILTRIQSDDPDFRMPPPESDKSLQPAQVALLARWIEQGAHWERHWSFVKPTRPPIPSVKNSSWSRNSIDRFILARLETEPLAPSPEATKETLLRRLTFDLTGLPPTLEEIESFLRDKSADAYERAVDRLLASPRYGEHMARYWLDAARYGDTHGKHLDNYREMWAYRDWVVNAFNANIPFDSFTLEQLAGDLLPDPTLQQLIATGFNRCNVTTSEGGSIEEEVYVSNVVDLVTTFGTVYLGLTLDCTRCHDHKFDPLTMRDFYALFGYFNSLDGSALDGNKKDPAPVLKVYSSEQRRQLMSLKAEIDKLEKDLLAPWEDADQAQLEWEKTFATESKTALENYLQLGEWYTVGPFNDPRRYLIETNFKKHGPEGKPVNLAEEFKTDSAEIVRWTRRIDWSDGKIHKDFTGDSAANFLYRTIHSPVNQNVTLEFGSDDGYRIYLNNKEVASQDIIRPVEPKQDSIQLNLTKGVNHLLIKLVNLGGESGFWFQIAAPTQTMPSELYRIAATKPESRTKEDRDYLKQLYRYRYSSFEPLVDLRKKLADTRNSLTQTIQNASTTLVWKESKERRPTYLLQRGNYDQRAKELTPKTPDILPPMSEELPNDRLGLAKWLLQPDQPLTARVTVNRFWQQIFGTGIVKTAEDFGAQGSPPSHPELLDWLAVDFVESGWDVKRLMKQLVMSATYRQSSRISSELYQRDPQNRLLARGSRYRLDGEMIRDQALAASGLLVNRLGGPSVKPPQPLGLWEAVGYTGSNTVKFEADVGDEKIHRRSLYTFIKRTSPPPQMSIFDGPSRECSCVRRERTNTPIQALLLMNDPQFAEAASALAERVLHEESDETARAELIFRLCTCRTPSAEELQELLSEVAQEREWAQFEATASSSKPGEHFVSHDQTELHAWTVLANVLLNLDEVINKN